MLDADGVRRSGVPEEFAAYAAELDGEKLRQFYRDMAVVRRFDQESTALQRQGELALWVPVRGQEAAQVGAVHASRPQDYFFPTYREHAIALARGVTPEELLRQFRGVSHGGWDPSVSRFHLYTLVLAAQTLHAVGYAMGVARDQGTVPEDPATAETVMAFFGDGASSEGDVHESMVFAASFNAPVVFFCQNNQWAISVPFEVQSKVPLATRAAGYGFPGLRVDGNDVLAVYAVTRWAQDRARRGEGPALIEAVTYRLGAHTTADDPTKYRGSDEEALWQSRDPMTRLKTLLDNEGLADQAFFDAVDAEAAEMAALVRQVVHIEDAPDLRTSFAHVYAQAHPLVAEELAFLESYEAGFADDDAASDAGAEATAAVSGGAR
nr:pyruvate dehydrogenase (acetyl-transferring) E1 component subunit alpha [Psychromicrobium sp. YIM S02556]